MAWAALDVWERTQKTEELGAELDEMASCTPDLHDQKVLYTALLKRQSEGMQKQIDVYPIFNRLRFEIAVVAGPEIAKQVTSVRDVMPMLRAGGKLSVYYDKVEALASAMHYDLNGTTNHRLSRT